MKAAYFDRHGGPEVMTVGQLPDPVAGPGQVLVRARASALNHIDLWLRRGLPRLSLPLPHIGGADVAGSIAALGPGVEGWALGTRVLVNPGWSCDRCVRCHSGQDNLCQQYRLLGESVPGGQAELVAVPARNLVAAPDGVADEVLAALPIVYLTAWHMLVDRARITPGDTVFVWAGGSGVGSAGIQIAKLHGARVIATASTADKRARVLSLGADEVLDSQDEGLGDKVKAMTGGVGADIVFEHTGAATFARSIRIAARGGRVVTCGATTGPRTELDIRHVFWRQLSILGATLAPRGRLFTIVDLVAAGRLQPVIDRVLLLDDVVEAHRAMESRQMFGKIVLAVGQG